jgi:hypothetical protein
MSACILPSVRNSSRYSPVTHSNNLSMSSKCTPLCECLVSSRADSTRTVPMPMVFASMNGPLGPSSCPSPWPTMKYSSAASTGTSL